MEINKRPRCHICHLNHPLQYCKPFRDLSVGLRWKSARAKGFCLNCLAYNHFRKECPSTKRCAAIVDGQPCNAFHHTLLHPEEKKNNVPAEPLREEPVANRDPAVTSSIPPVAPQQAVTSHLEDNKLATLADELHLEETSITKTQPSQGAVKRIFVKAATETPSPSTRSLVSQATQTPSRSKQQKALTPVKNNASTQTSITTSWPIKPIVRVNLNFAGAKMFTAFVLDRKAKRSYILWDVAKILPEFRPIKQRGEVYGRFILEPSFPHEKEDSFVMDLHIQESLDIDVPDPILDASLHQHFKQYEPLAHPFFYSCKQIDGVLGNDVARRILKPDIEQSSLDLPIAQASTFGWIISGVWRGCSCHSQGGVC